MRGGRKSFYLAASRSEDDGRTWTEAEPLVGPREKDVLRRPVEDWWHSRHQFSCANFQTVVTGPSSFLVAYSGFRHTNTEGKACKAIKVREVTVVPVR